MYKIGLMLLLAAANGNAMAEWEPAMYNRNNTNLTYVDITTIRKADNKVKMWSLVDLKTAEHEGQKQYMSIKSQIEYDCKARQMRGLFTSIHSENMGKGILVGYDTNTYNWMPVPAGSTGEVLWKIACGILKSHSQP